MVYRSAAQLNTAVAEEFHFTIALQAHKWLAAIGEQARKIRVGGLTEKKLGWFRLVESTLIFLGGVRPLGWFRLF